MPRIPFTTLNSSFAILRLFCALAMNCEPCDKTATHDQKQNTRQRIANKRSRSSNTLQLKKNVFVYSMPSENTCMYACLYRSILLCSAVEAEDQGFVQQIRTRADSERKRLKRVQQYNIRHGANTVTDRKPCTHARKNVSLG